MGQEVIYRNISNSSCYMHIVIDKGSASLISLGKKILWKIIFWKNIVPKHYLYAILTYLDQICSKF